MSTSSFFFEGIMAERTDSLTEQLVRMAVKRHREDAEPASASKPRLSLPARNCEGIHVFVVEDGLSPPLGRSLPTVQRFREAGGSISFGSGRGDLPPQLTHVIACSYTRGVDRMGPNHRIQTRSWMVDTMLAAGRRPLPLEAANDKNDEPYRLLPPRPPTPPTPTPTPPFFWSTTDIRLRTHPHTVADGWLLPRCEADLVQPVVHVRKCRHELYVLERADGGAVRVRVDGKHDGWIRGRYLVQPTE